MNTSIVIGAVVAFFAICLIMTKLTPKDDVRKEEV